MTARRSPLHGLTTRGRSLLAAGLAAGGCGVALDERDLVRVGVLLVALPVLSALVLSWSRLRLRATRTVEPAVLTVGGEAVVTLALHAEARLPVAGLLLTDEVVPALGEQPRYSVGTLARGNRATVRYPLQPRTRGRHPLGPLTAHLTDPLGLVETATPVSAGTTVLVHPRLLELAPHDHPSAPGPVDGASPAGTGRADETESDAMVRPYRDGDDLRTVHWRSTARRGEVMVRPPQHVRRTATVVLLDTRPDAHRGAGPGSSLERAIILAGSIAAHLRARGGAVRLLTTEGHDLGGGAQALEALALLRPGREANLGPVAERFGRDQVLAVLGRLDEPGAQVLAAHGRGRAVLLGPAGTGAATLRESGWTVLAPAEHTPLTAVWDALGTPQPAVVAR